MCVESFGNYPSNCMRVYVNGSYSDPLPVDYHQISYLKKLIGGVKHFFIGYCHHSHESMLTHA